MSRSFKGYERGDGSVGIRNKICIIAVDECCEGIARGIAEGFPDAVVLTNWYTCMLGGNEETFNQLVSVGTAPNVAGVIVIAMGCGSIEPEWIAGPVQESGRMAACLVCEKEHGTRKTIERGRAYLAEMTAEISKLERRPVPLSKLVVGVKCGGSDTSSGIASNPAVGQAVDLLIEEGASCIGGELFELQGCDEVLMERAVTDRIGEKILRLIQEESDRWNVEGVEVETMSVGNCVGGLTTIEEKSLGALHKTGTAPIQGVLEINKDGVDKIEAPGFYLSDASMLCGAAGVNFAALHAHMILWTTGSAGFDTALCPVIRVSGNEELINEDIDVDVSGIMRGELGLEQAGEKIVDRAVEVASGTLSNIEGVGYATLTLYQKDQRVEALLRPKCER